MLVEAAVAGTLPVLRLALAGQRDQLQTGMARLLAHPACHLKPSRPGMPRSSSISAGCQSSIAERAEGAVVLYAHVHATKPSSEPAESLVRRCPSWRCG